MSRGDITGGCYCKQVRYRAVGPALLKAECYCRECQFISGGGAMMVMAVPNEGFAIEGETRGYARDDWPNAVTRVFCTKCGTHVLTRAPGFPQGVILKVGSLDDPAVFGTPDFAAWAQDAQPYHRLPTDIPVHSKWPGMAA